MNDGLRVVQVNKFYRLKGGSEAYLFALERGLAERSIQTAALSMHHPDNRPSPWSDFFVDQVDYNSPMGLVDKVRSAARLIYSRQARRNMARLIDRFRPNLAHLHLFQHQISPSIIPELKKHAIPIIYTAHDLKSVCPNYVMHTQGEVCERCAGHRYHNCVRYTCVKDSRIKSALCAVEMHLHRMAGYYEMIDLVIAPSRFYRDKLVELRFPEHKVVHVPNFVDTAAFTPRFDHDGYCLYFGRLSREKGVDVLIRAMSLLPDTRLVIAGTGPMEAELRKLVASLGLHNVTLAGFSTGDDLKRLVSGAMCTVLPSVWYENGPVSLLESLASGTPVVGSDIGGIPEHITPGEDGLVVPPGDHEALAKAISSLATRGEDLAHMARAARTKAEECYDQGAHMDRIVGLYRELADSGHTART